MYIHNLKWISTQWKESSWQQIISSLNENNEQQKYKYIPARVRMWRKLCYVMFPNITNSQKQYEVNNRKPIEVSDCEFTEANHLHNSHADKLLLIENSSK